MTYRMLSFVRRPIVKSAAECDTAQITSSLLSLADNTARIWKHAWRQNVYRLALFPILWSLIQWWLMGSSTSWSVRDNLMSRNLFRSSLILQHRVRLLMVAYLHEIQRSYRRQRASFASNLRIATHEMSTRFRFEKKLMSLLYLLEDLKMETWKALTLYDHNL
jgi:hypothetical protein